MGRAARLKPARLGKKLLRIRKALDLSQDSMVERLGVLGTLTSASISAYELGKREPPLLVLLRYAELANVHLEVLADDRLDLPDGVLSTKKHGGLERAKKLSQKRR